MMATEDLRAAAFSDEPGRGAAVSVLHSNRPDLSNRALIFLVAAAVIALIIYFALLLALLPSAWRTPGSVELYIIGVIGAALLLVSMGFVAAKRTGLRGSPPAWFVAHVIGGTAGAVLVAIHSAGHLGRPPALLFVLLIALVVLGLWGRVRLARRMAATFASKQTSFTPASAGSREQFAVIIAKKRKLLSTIDGAASEGTFSLTLAHWLRSPRLAYQYAQLVREEHRLMGTRRAVRIDQAYWRLLHLAVAYLFVLGLIVHVVTVTFFAGYVADGRPITWWHITAW